jgi:CysZ protein
MVSPPMVARAPIQKPGFGAGLGAFFSGLGFVIGSPSVWALAAVPMLAALVLSGALAFASVELVPGWIARLIGDAAGEIATTAAQVVGTAVAVIGSLLIGFGLAQPLSGPALERIVRRHEARLGAPAWPPTSFGADIARSLQSVAVTFLFGAPILALLFLCDLFIPGAAFVCVPLKFLVTTLLLAWDLCDYPLSIRGVPVGRRIALVGRNVVPMLGFAFGLALLSFLPCLLLLLLPAGVAGAARLTFEIERYETQALPPHAR